MFGNIILVVCVLGYGLADLPFPVIPERQRGCPIPTLDREFCSRARPAFKCGSDSDCQKKNGKEYKCCVSSCHGRMCVEQNVYKQGACPNKLKKMCAMRDVRRCGVDSECPGNQLCCETACYGSDCREPAASPDVKLGCQLPPRDIFICPAIIPIFLCRSDDDCQGSEVCCKTACGSVLCIEPEKKLGTCPLLPLTQSPCLRTDPILCGVDKECEGQQKCCKTRCGGSLCKDTVLPELAECTDDTKWWAHLKVGRQKCKSCTCKKLRKTKSKYKTILKAACKLDMASAKKHCCATCKKYGY